MNLMKTINRPDLLNGIKQFKYSLKNNINNSSNLSKVEIKNTNSNLSFYINLLGTTFIILSLIILYYKYLKKVNKKDQIKSFIKKVEDYTNNKSIDR